MRRPSYDSRLRGLKIITDPLTKKKRFETSKNIEIPIQDSDLYIEVKKDTRLDKIAYELYSDPTLWWIICLANNMKQPWEIKERSVLRIPRFKENVMSLLNK